MNRRAVVGTVLAAAALIAAASQAQAASPRKITVANAPRIYLGWFYVPPAGATVETDNLSAGADTVMYAFDYSTGAFLAGNDDYGGSLRSLINLAGTPNGRSIRVIVRSYHSDQPGTATLRFTASGSAPQEQSIAFDGHLEYTGAGYAQGTSMQTAEAALGSVDTVLMAISGYGAAAVGFDDDSGVATMSRLNLPGTCNPCTVLVGTYPGATTGATTLYIDDGISSDADGDGIGDGLEGVLGTSPTKADSDGDGLADNIEIYGVESWPTMRLPAWGADPLKPDVFVEADWVQACDPAASDCTAPDALQLPPYWAEWNVASFAPDIQLHIDTGLPNTDPATVTHFGAWGGAERLATSPSDYCTGRADGFRRVFHHVVIAGAGDGGQTAGMACSVAGWLTVRHELGHQLGLGHGGGDGYNCKPHYHSPMNYAFQDDFWPRQFSRGQFASVPLNPYHGVNEVSGLGTSDPNLIGYLPTSAVGFQITSAGAIDWTRDGVWSSDVAPAAVTWPAGFSDCDLGFHGITAIGSGNKPSFAWVADATNHATLYTVYQTPWNGLMQRTVSKPNVDACQANPGTQAGCVAFGTATAVPNNRASWPVTALVSFRSGTALMLVYAGGDGLYYQTRTATADWSTAARVGSGQWNGGTGPTIVEYPAGTINVFSAGIGGITRNRYTVSSGTWDGAGTIATWSDGTPIPAGNISPALAVGYTWDRAPQQLLAVFTTPDLVMHLARYESNGTWTQFPDSVFTDYHQAWSKPGLAFAPTYPNVPNVGRFYLMYIPANGAPVAITMTEGNDPSSSATTRRLLFRPNAMAFNEWTYFPQGEPIALAYDPLRDTNVRAAVSDGSNASFAPIADALFNTDLKDYNDYALMQANLPGSLVATWP